jgi:GNAT superfamily N-acetyltransferase
MQPRWSARPYRDGDEEKILQLYKVVFPQKEYSRDEWLKEWHWLYKENPAGEGRIWLAEDKGKVVGQVSSVPALIKIGAETIVGFQGVNLMTHPDYRRQGIYRKLFKEGEAPKEGLSIVYTFPNQTSILSVLRLKMVEKLELFDVLKMQWLVKPLNWENSLKPKIRNESLLKLSAIVGNFFQKIVYRTGKAPVVEGLAITRVSCFDERINEFWAKVSSQYEIMVVRDRDYLNWRYVTIPGITYSIYIAEKADNICGYVVFRSMARNNMKSCFIFDILAQSPQVAQCLLSRAIADCKQEGVDIISCRMIANKILINDFRKNGFISVPFTKSNLHCIYAFSPEISEKFQNKHKNWFIQIGDSDML